MSIDSRVLDLLEHWESLYDQGKPVTPEVLCRDCPELLEEVKRRLDALKVIREQFNIGAKTEASSARPNAVVSTPTPESVPKDYPCVPGYEILDVLGRGGMGVVYKLRHLQLKRVVALKMILTGAHAGSEQLARFRIEAKAVARLQHPHIVQIHDLGEQDGLPYFSLEYVEGGSLAQKIHAMPLPLGEAAGMVETLARAMQTAHQRGIVHRDLKPANVLVTSDGIPKITDFGLAKQLDAPDGQTASGAIMGTPSYMSPEQAEGKTGAIGPATDIYALGAILYELLTGRPPFKGASSLDTLEQVRMRDPLPPSKVQPRVPGDLEIICLKCLAKEPAQRYTSALMLAQDLERFRAGEPILGRPERMVRRLWRRACRNPLLSTAVLLALVAFFTASYLSWRFAHVRQVSALNDQIQASLEAFDGSPERLTRIEALITDLEKWESQPAADARTRLNQRFANLIRGDFGHPRLSPDEVTRIEGQVRLLAARDAQLGSDLAREFQARRGQLQLVLDLHHPFELHWPLDPATPVFASAGVAVEEKVLVRRGSKGQKSEELVLTSVPCVGNVELQATFHSSWKTAPRVGLVLNADKGNGYTFILRRQAPSPAPPPGDLSPQPVSPLRAGGLTLSIFRNGVRVQEQPLSASEVVTDSLRLEVKREGNLFAFRVNNAKPLQYQDLFPLGVTNSGVFGLSWPDGVRLESLRAYCQSLPANPSPLERGDDFYARRRFDEAIAEYRRQASTSSRPDIRQETTYKEALCLLRLKQEDAGNRLLTNLAEQPGDRWPAAAALQLWVWYLSHDRMGEAEAVFQNLRYRYPVEKLGPLLPYEALNRLFWDSTSEGVEWIDFTPKRVDLAERAVAIEEFLQRDLRFRIEAGHQLVRVYWIAGREVLAVETARKLLQSHQYWLQSNPDYAQALLEDYCWLLRRRDEAGRAREILDNWLRGLNVSRGDNPAFGALLLERARTHAALKQWDQAEGDLKEFFRIAARHGFAYPEMATAYLIQGFLHEQRGQAAEALAAWRRGEYHSWRRDHPAEPADLPVRQRSLTGDGDNLILAALTGTLADVEAKGILTKLIYWLVDDAQLAKLVTDLGFSPRVLREMWRSPRGHELARKIAFRDLSFPEYVQDPIFLWAVETMHADAMPGDLSADQRALLDKLVRDLWATMVRGGLNQLQGLGLLQAWKGNLGLFGWAGATVQLDPSVRGPLAYLGGHRLLRLKKPKEAIELFHTAVTDAPPDSPLRRVAQAELDRLNAK